MTPLEERFRQRLEIYKQQKTAISKDKNLKKRIEKVKNLSDFQQQRQIQFTKVRNIAAKLTSGKTGAEYKEGAGLRKNGIFGGTQKLGIRGVRSGFTNNPLSVQSQGKTNVVSPGAQWTTSGWREINYTPSQNNSNTASPVKKQPKQSRLDKKAQMLRERFGYKGPQIYGRDPLNLY